MTILPRVIFSVVAILAGLSLGFLLRRLLVRRLRQTVLDDWLIQTLGVIVILAVLSLATVSALEILTEFIDLGGAIPAAVGSESVRAIFGKGVGSVFIIVLSVGIARTFSRITVRGLNVKRLDPNLRVLINRISYILVMLLAIFWVLSIWQVAIDLPVAVLGTLTIAVVFSIQDLLKDLVAGMYILLEHPFFIGDQISTANYTGEVVNVELRSTRLRLVSGEDITIPNALVFGGIVINNSRYAERRASILISLPLSEFSRVETAEQIVTCVKEVEEVLRKPEPFVSISGITGDEIELLLRFWIANGQLATMSDVMYALRTTLPHANLSMKETAGNM
jgi:small-conductance mechanosensitive channel